MEKVKIGNICEILNGYAFKSENYIGNGIRVIRIANVQKGFIEDNTPVFYPLGAKGISKYMLEENDLLISLTGNVGRVALLEKKFLPAALNQRVACLRLISGKIIKGYLFYFLNSDYFEQQCIQASKGVAQKNISTEWLKEFEIPLYSRKEQVEIVNVLDMVQNIINNIKDEIEQLDMLIKSRFVEMFGDLKRNDKQWPILPFMDFATIDTTMIHDFEKYKNYPHIGIDSIEKETGNILDYRTVQEDGVISGKYLFTPDHIIYSKIRPNLNKVALPNFKGVCSADAYPILPKKVRCNRIFLAYVMRSQVFLDYILAFSSRTNLPKVNKKQVEGFCCPIPDIALQEQFSAFVHQTDKLKVEAQKSLEKTQLLFDSLMQQYFG